MAPPSVRKVIVIGLDGLEPSIVEPMLDAGELPHLAALRAQGGYTRVGTTYPAQTPVAWSSFATSTNPGGHGIFDFIRRDPHTYLPDLSLNRYEQKNAFVPPKAVNLRGGTAVWDLLGDAGIPSTIIRCPCTYPPDPLRGRMLAGMGVPDLRGGLGTATFYTTAASAVPGESEQVVRIDRNAACLKTHVIGPRNQKARGDCVVDLIIEIEPGGRTIAIRSDGEPRTLVVRKGEWSDWLKVRFKPGLLQSVRGMVRFHLVATMPELELYASPVNFDPHAPLFPISAPPDYAGELAASVGTYYTAGMPEDHRGLSNGRIDEAGYLTQCVELVRERERMMQFELARHDRGLFFCLFDTPDRLQHMFWRFLEPDHPANISPWNPDLQHVIREQYRAYDTLAGNALAHADEGTLAIVLSDHGMTSFQRGVHLNTWLHDRGLLAFVPGVAPGDGTSDFFQGVNWEQTRAYALGLGGIYLNLRGREGKGTVTADEAGTLLRGIAEGLTGLADPVREQIAIRSVVTREQVYRGPYASDSPDLLVNFSKGYRASWATALGGAGRGHFEDNTQKWGGDHIVDPMLVPGVLFMNRSFAQRSATLLDLAPTILSALGVPPGPAMEGTSLLP